MGSPILFICEAFSLVDFGGQYTYFRWFSNCPGLSVEISILSPISSRFLKNIQKLPKLDYKNCVPYFFMLVSLAYEINSTLHLLPKPYVLLYLYKGGRRSVLVLAINYSFKA